LRASEEHLTINPVSEHHFIAKTYLKHWCDPTTGKLFAYRKNLPGEPFPCAPRDVCREWNGDLNPIFPKHPNLLGQYRKMFEPGWNGSLGSFRSRSISIDDKFVIAGYWAQLTTCTPTWRRHGVELYEHQLKEVLPIVAQRVAAQRPDLRPFINDRLAAGAIKPTIDDNYVKHVLTTQLTKLLAAMYAQEWVVLRNETDLPFLTSDNPSSILPDRPLTALVTRFLPLAPDLGILVVFESERLKELHGTDYNSFSSPGNVRFGSVDRSKVKELNRAIVMNADRFVLTTQPSEPVRRLVDNLRDYCLRIDHIRFPIPDGHRRGAVH
jgi:Protein of unknown function (DUF4238)